ncbi:hypothetical protein FQR65_LT20192 [Abscondita terminalis]|nr:hypothetical protein FQR65_LT20192 [Abscondita terminalis]
MIVDNARSPANTGLSLPEAHIDASEPTMTRKMTDSCSLRVIGDIVLLSALQHREKTTNVRAERYPTRTATPQIHRQRSVARFCPGKNFLPIPPCKQPGGKRVAKTSTCGSPCKNIEKAPNRRLNKQGPCTRRHLTVDASINALLERPERGLSLKQFFRAAPTWKITAPAVPSPGKSTSGQCAAQRGRTGPITCKRVRPCAPFQTKSSPNVSGGYYNLLHAGAQLRYRPQKPWGSTDSILQLPDSAAVGESNLAGRTTRRSTGSRRLAILVPQLEEADRRTGKTPCTCWPREWPDASERSTKLNESWCLRINLSAGFPVSILAPPARR